MEIIWAFSPSTKKFDGLFRFLKTSEGTRESFLSICFENGGIEAQIPNIIFSSRIFFKQKPFLRHTLKCTA